MRRILYIANYRKGIGGIRGQVEMLYQHVREDGYDVCVFSTKGNPVIRFWKFIQLICVAKRYDVLHIHACSYRGMLPAVYGVIAGKLWKKRIIVTYHGGDAAEFFKKQGAFAKRWLGRADEVIVLSGYLEKIFNEYNIPCRVIPNIVELPDITRAGSFNPQAPRFISMRHLRELYNIPCILNAFAKVQKQLPMASITILGDGPMRGELERYVSSHGIKNVSFVGQVPNTEVNHYLSSHDILLSSPRIDNMPVSLLEAMNAGALIISSKVGGVPYMIEDGKTGLMFPNNNDKVLAKQMLWAVNHPQEIEKIISAAHTEVQRYNWTQIRNQILPLYE